MKLPEATALVGTIEGGRVIYINNFICAPLRIKNGTGYPVPLFLYVLISLCSNFFIPQIGKR